jgi:RNA polymerase sigma-70 factor (ECF subfamily)
MSRGLDEQTYRKHADELIRFATFLVGPADASDVVSAAVLRTFESQAWAAARNQRAYLFRAVLNEVRMAHRGDVRRRGRELRAEQPESFDAPEPRPDVLEAVASLSPRQRAVIALTYWDDLTPEAVADLLGISEGAVRIHLARGRRRLRKVLDEHGA